MEKIRFTKKCTTLVTDFNTVFKENTPTVLNQRIVVANYNHDFLQ